MVQTPAPTRAQWWALAGLGTAQLMIILDTTVIQIALPTIQDDLDLSTAQRQWLVTGYTLAFGALVLLGGRIADYLGRKRTFLTGLLGFTAASCLGGAATNAGVLVAARVLQGTFAALLAPAALSMVALIFSDPAHRAKAFSIWGAIATSGSAIGLILGGALTDLSWRWCLYINVAFAALAAVIVLRVPGDATTRERGHYDLTGAALISAGLGCGLYGVTTADTRGWGATPTVALLIGAVVLIILFALVEARVRQPLLPLRIVTERNRGGAYLAVLFGAFGTYGTYLYLTYYLQTVLDYSPLKTGFAFLPITAGVVVSVLYTNSVGRSTPPRFLAAAGMLALVGGMAVLTTVTPTSSYAAGALPVLCLAGIGYGLALVVGVTTATYGVTAQDSGIASAGVSAFQQIGASVGTALLTTLAATATTSYLKDHPRDPVQGVLHGFDVGAVWCAGILVGGALIVLVLITIRRLSGSDDADAAVAESAGSPAR